jgi:rRNA-processing protein FCF1
MYAYKDELNKLLASDNDWVKKKAELALQFTEQFKNGEMDKSEYDELLKDLVRTDEVMSNAASMEAKAQLEKAITFLISTL